MVTSQEFQTLVVVPVVVVAVAVPETLPPALLQVQVGTVSVHVAVTRCAWYVRLLLGALWMKRSSEALTVDAPDGIAAPVSLQADEVSNLTNDR